MGTPSWKQQAIHVWAGVSIWLLLAGENSYSYYEVSNE